MMSWTILRQFEQKLLKEKYDSRVSLLVANTLEIDAAFVPIVAIATHSNQV